MPPSKTELLLRRFSLGVAVFTCATLMHQLATARALVFGVRMPAIYPLTILVALSLFGWAALSGRRRVPIAAAALAMVVFLANDRRLNSGDTKGAAALPFLILTRGTLELGAIAPPPPIPGWIVEREGRLWSKYPVTAGILALPVYLPATLGGVPYETRSIFPPLEKISASLMAAISVAFLLAALLRSGVSRGFSFGITALYAIASPILSVAAQALWQHTPAVLALSVALWAIVRARENPRFFGWAGLACGVAASARPTTVLVGIALWVWAAQRGWRPAVHFALAVLPPMALVALYNTIAFGAPWATGYGREALAFSGDFVDGLFGLLFSPTRGLVTFVPWIPLAFAGFLLGARRDRLHGVLMLASIAVIAVYAAWHVWWGGWCYGPRFMTDLFPLFAFGLVPLAAIPRRPVVIALLVTGLLGAALHGIGAFAARYHPAKEVYEVTDVQQTMDWARYPLVAPFLASSRNRLR